MYLSINFYFFKSFNSDGRIRCKLALIKQNNILIFLTNKINIAKRILGKKKKKYKTVFKRALEKSNKDHEDK